MSHKFNILRQVGLAVTILQIYSISLLHTLKDTMKKHPPIFRHNYNITFRPFCFRFELCPPCVSNLKHDILQFWQFPDGTHRAAAGRNRWVRCRRPGDRRRLRDVVIRHGRVATEGGRLRLDAWRWTLICSQR